MMIEEVALLAVDGYVAFALLHGSLVASGDGVNNPLGDVFCGRIERQNVIEIGVVEFAVDLLFDVLKVAHHAVCIEFSSLAVYGNNPVVAVNVGALAFVGKVEVMRPCDFHSLLNVIHSYDDVMRI